MVDVLLPIIRCNRVRVIYELGIIWGPILDQTCEPTEYRSASKSSRMQIPYRNAIASED